MNNVVPLLSNYIELAQKKEKNVMEYKFGKPGLNRDEGTFGGSYDTLPRGRNFL